MLVKAKAQSYYLQATSDAIRDLLGGAGICCMARLLGAHLDDLVQTILLGSGLTGGRHICV